MLTFVIRRVMIAIPMLVISSMVVFLLVALGGDPLASLRQPGVPHSALVARAQQLGLNKPLPVRYADWITDALHGNFGQTTYGLSVSSVLAQRALVSLRLIATAVVIALILAVVLGFISGARTGRWYDRGLVLIAVLLLALPEFWTALVVKQGAISFNQAMGHIVFYTFGQSTPGAQYPSFSAALSDYTSHMTLPTIVLVGAAFPVWYLYQRAAMADVMGKEYMLYARAKGLPGRTVLIRHGLRTSLIPLVTSVALRLPWLIGGLVVVETIFGWQGLGQMIVQAIEQQDVNSVLAWTLLMSSFTILLNLLADILYGFLDPRIRYGRAS